MIECIAREGFWKRFRRLEASLSLIILDLVAADMHSKVVSETMERRRVGTPVMLIGRYAAQMTKKRDPSCDGPGVISGPVFLYELLSKVRELLDFHDRPLSMTPELDRWGCPVYAVQQATGNPHWRRTQKARPRGRCRHSQTLDTHFGSVTGDGKYAVERME